MISRVCSLLKMGLPERNRGLLWGSGTVVPSDNADGYQTGCVFVHTDGGAGTAVYINEGSVTACDFNAVASLTVAQEALLGATAGTVAASKAVIVDASKNISGFNDVSMVGALTIAGATTYAIDIATSGVFRMGVQDTGVDLTTAYPFAVDVQCEANADIVAGATGSTAGVYVRYAIETAQTSNTAHIGMFGKLRVKANLGEGNHAGVMGWVEISGTTVLGGSATTTTAAGSFSVIAESGLDLSTGHLNGVVVDCSVDDAATITGILASIRLKRSAGCYSWPTGIQFEANSATSCIDIACATTPNTTRTNHGFVMGGRGADELTVTFAGGAGAEHYEPVTMNFDMVGTNPASTSTVNVWQGAITLDTDALANVRLKWTDLLTTVSKNCTDVYIHQGEIVLSGTTTISSEVAVLGLVVDGGAGTITCTAYKGVGLTMRGSGTPATAKGYFLNVVAGCTIASGIYLEANGTCTTGLVLDSVPGSGTFTNLLAVDVTNGPAVATVEAGDAGGGSIRILVDGAAKWLHYWDNAS